MIRKNGQKRRRKNNNRQTEGHKARDGWTCMCLRRTISPVCGDQCLERKALMGTECHFHLHSGSSCTQDMCRASRRKRNAFDKDNLRTTYTSICNYTDIMITLSLGSLILLPFQARARCSRYGRCGYRAAAWPARRPCSLPYIQGTPYCSLEKTVSEWQYYFRTWELP